MKLIQMSDSIHKLQDKLQHLQSEILDTSRRKSVGQEELNDLQNEIINTKEKLDSVKKTFNIKYEELKEVCSQTQKLQNYVEKFTEGQDYQELESVVGNEVEKALLDNRKLLQNALFSILLALRNQPDRYYIVDSMELTPFTTIIINYDSFLALRRASIHFSLKCLSAIIYDTTLYGIIFLTKGEKINLHTSDTILSCYLFLNSCG
jgi:hypothetical protein